MRYWTFVLYHPFTLNILSLTRTYSYSLIKLKYLVRYFWQRNLAVGLCGELKSRVKVQSHQYAGLTTGFRATHVTNVAQIVNKMFPVWSRVAPVRSGRYTADQYINILPTEPKRGIKIPRSQPFLNQFRPTYEKCFRWTGNFKKSKCASLTKYRKLFFAYILITQCSRTGTCDSRS